MNVQQTSIDAYYDSRPRRVTQRDRIRWYVTHRGINGATDEEISEALGIRRASVCGARFKLVEIGDIIDSGYRRKSSAGVLSIIWQAKSIYAGYR